MVFSSDFARGARRLKLWTGVGLGIVAVIVLYAAVAGIAGIGQSEDFYILGSDGSVAERIGLISAALAGTPLAVALWRLRRMLHAIEGGEIFTSTTVRELRGFALFVMISALASILVEPLVVLIAGLAAGADEVKLRLTFELNDFFILLVSVLLFFVSRLFSEAQRLADENAQIV